MLPQDADYCLSLLRENARDIYLASLLLPVDIRAPIVVLQAFHVELTNIALAAREPMAGEMRLQWWADVIAGNRAEEAKGHPLARALVALIEMFKIPIAALDAKIAAHIFDLYQDPMGDRTMLEGYLGETRSILFQLATQIAGLNPTKELADASGHAGVSFGSVAILQNAGRTTARGQVYFPSDLLSATGLDRNSFLAPADERHMGAVIGLCDLAEEHREKAVKALGSQEKPTRKIFNLLALVPLYLRTIRRDPLEIFNAATAPSQFARQFALWRF